MRNKFNYGELVKVNGIGEIYVKVKNKLGFIIEKDSYYADYYIDLIFGKKDWFKEKSIERILGKKKNKVERYQIRLCTTVDGYELIKHNLQENGPISNNKLGQINIYKRFSKKGKDYIIVGWSSVFWPVSNKSIHIIENTIRTFKGLDIPFQYIVMNEENITDIEIYEFTDNDSNVKVFSIERKIKIKNLKQRPPFEW